MPDPAPTITLFCWILDKYERPFPIQIEEGKFVNDLKDLIREKALKDCVTNSINLAVWKVSISISGNIVEKVLECKYDMQEALPESNTISYVFPSKPAKDTISIVTKILHLDEPPLKRTRFSSPDPFNKTSVDGSSELPKLDHTPSKPLAEVKSHFHRILDHYRPTMRGLVTKAGQEPLIPSWIPKIGSGDKLDTMFRNHIKKLEIPAVEGLPSLLLHQLGLETSIMGQKQSQHIDAIFSLNDHTVVVNTSGSGKTRLGLHGLCKNWGFYGITKQTEDDIGSRDFEDLMSTLDNSLGYNSAKALGNKNKNATCHMMETVEHCILQFILSRFLILNLLIEEASKSKGGLRPSDHRILWVLLQARPTDLLEDDAFIELSNALRVASTEDLKGQIKEEYSKLEHVLEQVIHPSTGQLTRQPLYCFLDEIQSMATSRMGEYLSKDEKMEQPLLQPIWIAITNILKRSQMLVILSGTSINIKSLEDIVNSSNFKIRQLGIENNIGAFDDPDNQRQYIEHYLLDEQSVAWQEFLKRAWGWCRGRYRITATLISLILMTGPHSPHKILDCFVKSSTNFMPTDGEQWSAQEPQVEGFKMEKIRGFEFEKLSSGQIKALRQVLYDQIVHGSYSLSSIIDDDRKAFIQYGFARTKLNEDVIDEPMVIMAAWDWLDKEGSYSLFDCLQHDIEKHAPRKNGFEAYLAFYFRKVFERNPRLNDVFTFRSDFARRGSSDLSWQREKFELVTVSIPENTNQLTISTVTPSCGPSSNIGLLAKTDDNVLDWVSTNEGCYAFCFPPESAGPDFFFYVRSRETERILLVTVQAKRYNDIDKQTLIDGVRTITPSLFWKSTDKKANEATNCTPVAFRFLDAVMKHKHGIITANASYPILRIFASWEADAKLDRTLDVDENSKGHKSRKSQAEVDEEGVPAADTDLHPLATLHLDNFNNISRQLSNSRYRGDTEEVEVVFAKNQYNKEMLLRRSERIRTQ